MNSISETVRVTMAIRVHRINRANSHTLVREVVMGHLPGVGDLIEVDEEGGSLLRVVRRHWSFHGYAVLYLNDIFVDPEDDVHIHADEVKWTTDPDLPYQDPIAILHDSGWKREGE